MTARPQSVGTVGLYAGDDLHVVCHRYPDRAPILVLSTGGLSVTLTTRDREAGDAGLTFAKELHLHVQTFLAECARLTVDDGQPTASAA